MDRADFVHLVRLSEHESATDSTAYRRRVAVFALLGYAWVVGGLLAGIGILWWVAQAALHGRVRPYHLMIGLAGLGLLWTGWRALWFRMEAPEGLRIERGEAPALFEALERIRRKIKGPPIHDVFLNGSLNASIGQRPRWGVFGGARNHLTLGLPLLMALDRQRLLAVLAHEYGHLRGDHGRFAAWVYRTRVSWARFDQGLQHSEGFASWLTRGFLQWYFPRFVARTFALARQDEYEADRIAGRLLGPEVAGAALVEIQLKFEWLQQFWREHWALAAGHALPVGPYDGMRKALAQPLPEGFARSALRQALRRISDVDDTHPVLRDRLEALEVRPVVPAPSSGSAMQFLGVKADAYLAHFDRQWCRENATEWKHYHSVLARRRARRDALEAMPPRNAEQWTELGDLQLRLGQRRAAQASYEQALALAPGSGPALRGFHACLPPGALVQRLAVLERLFGAGEEFAWPAAQEAVAQLEADPQHDTRVLQAWRLRLKDAEAAEARAAEELSARPHLEGITAAGLSDFERDEFAADLARLPQVRRAWIVRKALRTFPARRAWLLVVDLPGMEDEDRWELCRALEHRSSLGGSLLALWVGTDPTQAEVQRKLGAPWYEQRTG